jgi:hypothetical protein
MDQPGALAAQARQRFEALWQAQQNGGPPDEAKLMECLRDKLKR